MKIVVLSLLLLSGCATGYNDPDRFLGRLPPDVLARIEPPLPDGAPGAPDVGGYHPGTAAIFVSSQGAYLGHHGR